MLRHLIRHPSLDIDLPNDLMATFSRQDVPSFERALSRIASNYDCLLCHSPAVRDSAVEGLVLVRETGCALLCEGSGDLLSATSSVWNSFFEQFPMVNH